VREGRYEALPLGRLGSEDVVGAHGRLELRWFAHEVLFCPGSWRKASKTPSTPLSAAKRLLRCAGSASSTSKTMRTMREPRSSWNSR